MKNSSSFSGQNLADIAYLSAPSPAECIGRNGWRCCVTVLITCICLETIFVILSGTYLYIPQMYQKKNVSEIVHPTPEEFLDEYKVYCESELVKNLTVQQPAMCPCVPNNLEGHLNVTFAKPLIGEMELAMPDIKTGGAWSPLECTARQKVAIVVPFRDREEHLRIFLNHMHPIFQRQLLDYRIFVVEQAKPEVFNKASMMNIGFKEALKLASYDCVVFHDVDMMVEDDRNIYTCSSVPRHVGSHCDKWHYKVPYEGLFGGATAFRPEHFQLINGYSNQFYGWGGEDDDMYQRTRAHNFSIVRYPSTVARYTMIKHTHDKRNPYNVNGNQGWKHRPDHYLTDGLSSLYYIRRAMEERPLYTWIYAEVARPLNFGKPLPRKGSSSSLHSESKMFVLCVYLLYVVFGRLNR